MEECSLDLIFKIRAARPFAFLVGEGLFFPTDETRFLLQQNENM